MSAMRVPTCKELMDEMEVAKVSHTALDTWRHGCRVTDVFYRPADNTHWQAEYRLSTDQETNELKEAVAKITEVIPMLQTVTVFVPKPTPA